MILEETLKTLILYAGAVLLGILAGNSAVYVFNKIPAKWLCDYGEEPGEELRGGRQRITSHPWKAFFSLFFVLAGVKLAMGDPYLILPAMTALWALLEIAAADCKYRIIPDQFVVLLALSGLGFIPCYPSVADPLTGALLAGGCMLLVSVGGRFIFKKETLGFGDVKLFAVTGLLLGFYGAALVLLWTSVLCCIVYSVRLLSKKIKRGDAQPLGPCIAVSVACYLLFFMQ